MGPAGNRDYLIVSQLEIRRVLASLRARQSLVAIYFDDEQHFIASRIVDIDDGGRWLALAFGPDKAANARIRAASKLEIACIDKNAKVEFAAPGSSEVMVDGVPALRIPFPAAIVRLRRLDGESHAVPPHGPVEIVLRLNGVGELHASVIDMSRTGAGMISYPADTWLTPDGVINGCTLRLPSGDVPVNVEIMHSSAITADEGELVRHSECRFIGRRRDLQALLERFVVRLSDA